MSKLPDIATKGDYTVWEALRFGSSGASTTSRYYATIADSDITVDWDNWKNSRGEVYVNIVATMKNTESSETTYARVYRQNELSSVSGTEVSVTGNSWTIVRSGWVDFSGESGDESYHIQLKTSGGKGIYNSVLLVMGLPER